MASVTNSGEVGGATPTPRHTNTHWQRCTLTLEGDHSCAVGDQQSGTAGPQRTSLTVSTRSHTQRQTPETHNYTYTLTDTHTQPRDRHTNTHPGLHAQTRTHSFPHTPDHEQTCQGPTNLENQQMHVHTGMCTLVTLRHTETNRQMSGVTHSSRHSHRADT